MLRGTDFVGFIGLPPTMTVLQFLRGPEGGRPMGTKEGCAEGDCGACTVVLGELDGDGIRYRAVNSCIQFVPTLDGKQLITVEDLKGPDGRCIPVQQAMVETHGSQCGFCTPGFVMSLFALFHEGKQPDRAADRRRACRQSVPLHRLRPDHRRGRRACASSARAISSTSGAPGRSRRCGARENGTLALVETGADNRRYFAPATRRRTGATDGRASRCLPARRRHRCRTVGDEAASPPRSRHLSRPRARAAAAARSSTIGSRSAPPSPTAICTSSIGAHYPDFGELIRRFGSTPDPQRRHHRRQRRQRLADRRQPAAADRAGRDAGAAARRPARREMPLEDYFIAYGKQDRAAGRIRRADPPAAAATRLAVPLLQDLEALRPGHHGRAGRLQHQARETASSKTSALRSAAWRRRRSAPWPCEAALTGKPWTRATVAKAQRAPAQDFTPISDMRAQRRRIAACVAENLLLKFFIETTEADAETRVVGKRRRAHG